MTTATATPDADKTPTTLIDRNGFEDAFPVMFQFYKDRGKMSEEQLTKTTEIQSRWKAGLVFWLTSDNKVIEIPDWVAMNVVINNKTNVFRSSRICMSLNHTKGYGCNRLADGTCSYIHECVLCGQTDHGVFQKRPNGTLICKRLRKWNEEEERFKNKHGDTTAQEDKLSDLAQRGREQPRPRSTSGGAADGATSPQNAQQAPRGATTRPPDQAQKVKTLTGTTGCSEQQALELLVANRWNIQLAADAYFELDADAVDADGNNPAGSLTSGAAPGGWNSAWAPPVSHTPARTEASAPKQAAAAPKAVANTASISTPTVGPNSGPEELAPGALDLGSPFEDSTPSPPPAQPPPPRMPMNWQALWSEQHQTYYFWHIPTSKTQWEVPPLDTAGSPTNDGATVPPSAKAPGSASAFSMPPAELNGIPCLGGMGPLCGSLGQLQLGHEGDNLTAAGNESRENQPRNSPSGTAMERGPPKRLAEQGNSKESFMERTEAQIKAEELWACREGHYMCTQHWWPPEGGQTCMRLFHGEHVTVTWTDGKESGWAYGHIIDDTSHEGYFPQAVLKEVKRAPRRRAAGEANSVVERFEAPSGVAGYLTVSLGDVLKVLHPMEAPAVWVYVELMTISGPEVGWVPEAVLNNAHPAG